MKDSLDIPIELGMLPNGRKPSLRRMFAKEPESPEFLVQKNEACGMIWSRFARLLTCFLPNVALSWCGMKSSAIQQAWREKIALCCVIACLMSLLFLITLGLNSLLCPVSQSSGMRNAIDMNSFAQGLIGIRGKVYNTSYTSPESPFYNAHPGQDFSNLFPEFINCQNEFSTSSFASFPLPCQQDESCLTLTEISSPPHSLQPAVVKEPIALASPQDMWIQAPWASWQWSNVTKNPGKWVVFNGIVLDLTLYQTPNLSNPLDYNLIQALSRKETDISSRMHRSKYLADSISCLESKFAIGILEKTSVGCAFAHIIQIIILLVVVTIIAVRFLGALIFRWIIAPKLTRHPKTDKQTNVICLVTCYSENRESLETTLTSLANTSHPHKLLLVIADGLITGSGHDKSTPEYVLDLMDLDPEWSPCTNFSPLSPGQSYLAVSESMARQHNQAIVFGGHYHGVPCILVAKCGTVEEREVGVKAGNRGKRDSQLLLMRFLERVLMDQPFTPLDYQLFRTIHSLMTFTPDLFDAVLMVDADTMVDSKSLTKLVHTIENDERIMGLCGETQIANKSQNFVTMMQVFDYHISHHLGKSFESLFGGVTCLPGCFCMYRIKVPSRHVAGGHTPILVHPDVVDAYAKNQVHTLHQKNLLLLGEDRFLTILMLKTFPTRKMLFIPSAICWTVIPDTFKVLLSQRRRWINSTIHNLLELVLVRELCGICLVSMQFVILVDLIGTIVLPAALALTFTLIVSFILTLVKSTTPLTLDQWMPLVSLLLVFISPAILSILTTRRVEHVAWMIVYLLSLPVWNFILPLYSYWHFDEFSWGKTRKIQGLDKVHDSSEALIIPVPMKRWKEYELDHRRSLLTSARREVRDDLHTWSDEVSFTTQVSTDELGELNIDDWDYSWPNSRSPSVTFHEIEGHQRDRIGYM